MRNTILGIGLILVLVSMGIAQKVDSKAASTISNTTSASKSDGGVMLQSGTQIVLNCKILWTSRKQKSAIRWF